MLSGAEVKPKHLFIYKINHPKGVLTMFFGTACIVTVCLLAAGLVSCLVLGFFAYNCDCPRRQRRLRNVAGGVIIVIVIMSLVLLLVGAMKTWPAEEETTTNPDDDPWGILILMIALFLACLYAWVGGKLFEFDWILDWFGLELVEQPQRQDTTSVSH